MPLERAPENPVITPADVPPSRDDYEVVGAFNAGATMHNGEVVLLLRVAERPRGVQPGEWVAPVFNPDTQSIDCIRAMHGDPELDELDSRIFRYRGELLLTSISHLRLARSNDGIHFNIDPAPALFPENRFETYGLEDPRITQIGADYYIVYKAVSESGVCVALAQTQDFLSYERMGLMFCPENLDVCLFPEKIGGDYYALTRPVPYLIGKRTIWLARSPDLIHWGHHAPIIAPRNDYFDSAKTGGSAVPIRTEKGWLEIYHGVDHSDRYTLGLALLDLENPYKVLARSATPILEPEAPYETDGFYGNVVFSCGAVERDGELLIYYGAADESMAVARTTIDDLLNTL